ncbi:nucleotide-diphospho-sugar transferases superfamily protein [Carex rostrata]
MHQLSLLLLGFIFSLHLCTSASSTPLPNLTFSCSDSSQPDPLTLIPDRLTIVISGHSPRRLPLLRRIIISLSTHPSVHSIFVVWSNPSTPLSLLYSSLPLSLPSISLVPLPSSSLNLRFFPLPPIQTRAVAISDDDVSVPHRSLSFALSLWQASPTSLIGFFPRSHDLDISRRDWIYTVHPDRFSILLTKFLILDRDYLWKYSCSENYAKARLLVDKERNCEDILMNFVVAMEGGTLPVFVDAGGVRDWGDPRNRIGGNVSEVALSDDSRELEGIEVKKVGLSSRGEMHWRKRGECIREFHKLLGKMPLRFSYGKMTQGVREQALCQKGGKIVSCDHEE